MQVRLLVLLLPKALTDKNHAGFLELLTKEFVDSNQSLWFQEDAEGWLLLLGIIRSVTDSDQPPAPL